MAAPVTVPDRRSRFPIRLKVVGWRLIGSGAVVLVALVASGFPVFAHRSESWGARLECEGIPGMTSRVSPGGGSEPAFCYYSDSRGRTMDAHPSPMLGPPNLFEPRMSFVVAAVVLAVIWGLALVALWFIWHTGRARRLPRDTSRVLVV